MFQSTVDFLGAPFTELFIFILLVTYVVIYRNHKHLAGISKLKVLLLAILFIYFAWMPIFLPNLISPALIAFSVFGMLIINFYLFYSLILSRIEWPYRGHLATLANEPGNREIFPQIWSSGKRFYYCYYIFQSLVSGSNPFRFLKEIAEDRVQDDIKAELRQMGVEKKLVSLPLMIGFMRNRLACDLTLPAEFKALMSTTLDDLEKHPWIEEQVNEFLRIATETPEDLHFPEWTSAFEECARGR
jgi:hypothetical protein